MEELEELYTFAIEVAEEAGQILLESAQERIKSQSNDILKSELKASPVDIVTQVDTKVEQFIRNKILSKYPHHEFLGEESYSASNPKSNYILNANKPTWCVDPLDGTVNYVHLFPMVCVSIAFCLDGWPVIGVVNAPFLKETYSAYKNGGAWLNKSIKLPLINQPLIDSKQVQLTNLLLSMEWGKDRDYNNGNLKKKIHNIINLAQKTNNGGYVHGLRSLGSATLDMVYIARGSSDIYWEAGCWEWDVAAGICLIEESGGLVTNANPPDDLQIKRPPLGGRQYLAVRSATNNELTSKQQQETVIREIWKRVEPIHYQREGLPQ